MIFPPFVNDLAHMFASVLGLPVIVIGSAFLVAGIFWSLTAVTIFMLRGEW